MKTTDYAGRYKKIMGDLLATHGVDEAMSLVVGGQYRQIGILESSALLTLGMRPEHTVVDVGCGSGRLAVGLRPHLKGKYIGTDILGEALDYAREKAARPDWEFHLTADPVIPAGDGVADFVCFFSVFTHLLDEDSYRFLSEAKRVAKPGGRIVFSYLDYDVPFHWAVFLQTLADRNPDRVLNKFIGRSAIAKWSLELGLEVERIYDGSECWIRLTEPFRYDDGREASGVVDFGHSVGILRVP